MADRSALTGTAADAERLRVRLSRAVGWNLVDAVFNQGSTFVANVLLAHLLGVHTFGAYAIVQSTLAALSALGQLATGYTATKYVAEYRTTDPARAGRLLGLLATLTVTTGAAVAIILAAGSTWIARAVFEAPALSTPLTIAAAGVFFTAVNRFLLGALAGLESYGALGRTGVLSGTAYVALTLGFAAVGGLNGAVAGLVLAALLQSALLARVVQAEAHRQHVTLRFRPMAGDTGVIWRFAIPAALNAFVSMSAIWFGNAILLRQPGGYELVALFTAANSVRIVVLFLPTVLNNVSMSLLNNQRGVGDSRRFTGLFWSNLAATVAIVVGGAAAFALAGPQVLRLFGQDFIRGYPILLTLMLASVPEGVSVSMYQLIQSRERVRLGLLVMTLPCYAALAASAWFLIPAMGALGLAWSYVIAWTVAMLMSGLIVARLGTSLTPAASEPGGW